MKLFWKKKKMVKKKEKGSIQDSEKCSRVEEREGVEEWKFSNFSEYQIQWGKTEINEKVEKTRKGAFNISVCNAIAVLKGGKYIGWIYNISVCIV